MTSLNIVKTWESVTKAARSSTWLHDSCRRANLLNLTLIVIRLLLSLLIGVLILREE